MQDAWSRRESWPPTQMRLSRSSSNKGKAREGPRPLLEDIDENPLTYFLEPSPGAIISGSSAIIDDEDNEDDAMDFDAGIEDANNPPEMVRSVSPSSLGKSGRPRRIPSPDFFDSDGLTTDEEDDEDYVRFSPPSPSFLSPWRAMSAENLALRSKSPPFGRLPYGPPVSASFPAPHHSRGRHSLPRSFSARLPPRPNRLWREPSPDVWSIQEETEDELVGRENKVLEYPAFGAAAKPKKRVRFILPPKE